MGAEWEVAHLAFDSVWVAAGDDSLLEDFVENGIVNSLPLPRGEYVWRIPLGQYPELVAQGLPDTVRKFMVSPLSRPEGCCFISAADFDNEFRAFDKATGKLLWQARLPFPGNATPAIYEIDARQYVVIVAGGNSASKLSGAVYAAFALSK